MPDVEQVAKKRSSKSISRPPANITFYKENAEGRSRAETFLRDGFKKSFSAETKSFMPLILEISDNNNKITACVGIRKIAKEAAFLETYLDEPVETYIKELAGKDVRRSKIIELGSIISAEPGSAGWLIIAGAAWLKGAGYEWATLTATDKLKRAMKKQGIDLIPMAPASAEALPLDEQGDWGTYYDHNPEVYAGNVNDAYETITKNPLIMHLMGGVISYCHSMGQQKFF